MNLKLIFFGGISILAALLLSGIASGWSAFLLILENEGVYSRYCSHTEDSSSDLHVNTCPEQISNLNLIFTVGSTINTMSSLPLGILLDKWKEKKLFNGGCFFVFLACVCAAYGKDWCYFLAFIFLGFGTPAIFLALLRGTRVFPPHTVSVLIALLNSSYDASVFVFTVFKLIYDRWGGIGKIFVAYSFIPVLFAISTLFWPLQNEEISTEESLKEENYSSNVAPKKKENFLINYIGRDTIEASKSNQFMMLMVYNMVSMLWLNSTLGTVEYQWKNKLGDERGLRLAEIFGFILPAGFIAGPFVGTIIEKIRMSYSFFLISFSFILFSALNFVPIFEVQIVNFVIFTLCRAYYYSVLASFTIKVFGFQIFGRLFGLVMFGAGVFGMLQTFLVWVSVDYFEGSFLPYNLMQLVSHVVLLFFPIYLWKTEQNLKSFTIVPDVDLQAEEEMEI